jgi:hypothetical protein
LGAGLPYLGDNVDLRGYYQQLRQQESNIADEYAVVVSNATPDGGKAGVRTEVSRATAAKLIVEGRARLATPEESEAYRDELREMKLRADQETAAARVQVTVISDAEIRALRERRPAKG